MASMDKKLVNGYAITTLSIKKHFILTFYPVNLDIERKKTNYSWEIRSHGELNPGPEVLPRLL
jgi:hypothetical protein